MAKLESASIKKIKFNLGLINSIIVTISDIFQRLLIKVKAHKYYVDTIIL